MLPKKYRFPFKNPQRKHQFPRGVRHQGPFFNLVIYRDRVNVKPPPPQFAFVVSGRLSKKAVVRNRVRRLLQEAVHSLLKMVKPGVGVIVIGKQNLVGRNLKEVKKELESFFKKSGLIATQTGEK